MKLLLYPTNLLGHSTRVLWSVFLVIVGLVVMILPGRVEAAWVVPGDPSELTATPSFDSSCTIHYTGTLNVPSTGIEEVYAVCTGRTAGMTSAVSAIGSGLSGIGSGSTQVEAFSVCRNGTNCTSDYRLDANASGGTRSLLLEAEVTPCGHVDAPCFEFRFEFNHSGASGIRQMLNDDTPMYMQVWVAGVAYPFGNSSSSKTNVVFDWFPLDPMYPPPYYWVEAWVPEVIGACEESVEMRYSLNGEEIDIVEAMDTNVTISDRLILGIVIHDGAYPDVLGVGDFAWRRRPGTPWLTPTTASQITPPILGTVIVSVILPIMEPFPLDLAELRCTDELGDNFLDGGNNWSQAEKLNRACASIAAVLPREQVSSGATISARYTLEYNGPYIDSDVWVDIRFWTVDGDVDDVTTWTVYGSQLGGATPFAGELRVDAPLTGDMRFDAPADMTAAQGQLWCTDSVGSMRLPGDGIPSENGWTGQVKENSDCYSGAGMGVAPSTWIRGFARMGGCLAGELVVPDSEVVSEVATDTMNEVGSVPPFSFFLVGVTFVDTAQESFENPTGTGCMNLGGMVPGTEQDSFCVGSAGVTTGPQRAILAMLLGGGIYLSCLMHAVSLVREK